MVSTHRNREDGRLTKTKLLHRVSHRTHVDIATVRAVYGALIDEIIETVRFYMLHKHGHAVQFTKSGSGRVPDYDVLKFSASLTLNRSLTASDDHGEDADE